MLIFARIIKQTIAWTRPRAHRHKQPKLQGPVGISRNHKDQTAKTLNLASLPRFEVEGEMGGEGKSRKRPPSPEEEERSRKKHEKRKHRKRDGSKERDSKHKHSKEKHKRNRRDRDTNFEEISQADYFSKNNEFATWLKEERETYFSDLSAEAARDLFSRFVKEWNKGKLQTRYYEGITSGPRSAHKWNIKK